MEVISFGPGDENCVKLSVAESNESRRRAFELRRKVFLLEVGRDREIETDEEDETAVHVIAQGGGEVLATLRLYRFDTARGEAKIGRVAVRSDLRGMGLGTRIMRFAHEIAKERGCSCCYLHAEMGASGFYDKLGYIREGGQFEEAGLLHQRMYFEL